MKSMSLEKRLWDRAGIASSMLELAMTSCWLSDMPVMAAKGVSLHQL